MWLCFDVAPETNLTRYTALFGIPGLVVGALLFPGDLHGGAKLLATARVVNLVFYFFLFYAILRVVVARIHRREPSHHNPK